MESPSRKPICLTGVAAFFACVSLVNAVFRPDIVVAKDGSGHFSTIQAAINSVPAAYARSQGKLIFVKAGVYNETVVVKPPQRFLTIVGVPGLTRVINSRYSGQLDANGDAYRTAGSGTFITLADDFTAINMIFQNTSPRPPPNTYDRQAVALRVSGNRSVIYNCGIYSYQDSLYAHQGIHYYKNCHVFGSVDFIFGYAKAYFDTCTVEISSLGYGGITAQHKRFLYEDSGFVFNGGLITGSGKGFLGRAWGKFSMVIFANMQIDNVVIPDGWDDFGIRSRRYTSSFVEYNNRGIGANTEGRVGWMHQLTSSSVAKYLTPKWISLSSWLRPFPSPLPGMYKRKALVPSRKDAAGCSFTSRVGPNKAAACYRCCKLRHANSIGNCYRFCSQH